MASNLYLMAALYALRHGVYFIAYRNLRYALGAMNTEHDYRKARVLALITRCRKLVLQAARDNVDRYDIAFEQELEARERHASVS